ncbi:DNA-binding protein, partial [Escherichia coli]|uniref:DNA-binding protein n=1 Tax=Escherichia coli TaxID=562 RepID=UPI0039F0F91F
MARGVQETEVFEAADALLGAGERPTVERVRLRLGRGSPNTIGPLLDAWWAQLA